MKNHICSIMLILFAYGVTAQEIKNEPPNEKKFKNSIKIHPLNLFVNEYVVEYERVVGTKSALSFTLSQGYERNRLFAGGVMKSYFTFLEVDYRHYLSKSKLAPKGWFVAAGTFGLYELYRYKNIPGRADPNFDRDYFTTGVSMDTGYQWIFNNGINIGLSAGADLRIPVDHNISTYVRGNLNFSVGYSW